MRRPSPCSVAIGPMQADAVLGQVAHRDRRRVQLHPPALDGGEIQHALDHFQQMPPGLHHRADARILLRGQPAFDAQQFGVAEDAVERRAQFVRHHGDEAGLGLVGLFGGFLGGAQFGFGGLAGGDLLLQRGFAAVSSRSEPASRWRSSVCVTALVIARHRLAAFTWSFTR